MDNGVDVSGETSGCLVVEMPLVEEIHDSPVPVCATSFARFEIYGASVPSGEVVGDLADVVERPGGWIGYVADVSGHGVQSGVLMAMFKTAMRAQIARGDSPRRIVSRGASDSFSAEAGEHVCDGRDSARSG